MTEREHHYICMLSFTMHIPSSFLLLFFGRHVKGKQEIVQGNTPLHLVVVEMVQTGNARNLAASVDSQVQQLPKTRTWLPCIGRYFAFTCRLPIWRKGKYSLHIHDQIQGLSPHLCDSFWTHVWREYSVGISATTIHCYELPRGKQGISDVDDDVIHLLTWLK